MPAVATSAEAAVAALRRQWAVVALGGLAVLGASFVQRPLALLISVPVWAICLSILFGGLEENRGRDTDVLALTLGWPTAVTLVRGLLISILAGSAVLSPALGAAAYAVAAVLDHVDGRLARRLGRTTRLGARLDMEIDALGILVATAVAIHAGKLGPGYLAVGLARYLFAAALWLRSRAGKRIRPLDPSDLRRVLAGCQMGFLAVALWPAVPPELTRAASLLFGGATLAMFCRDYRFAASDAA